MKRLLTGIWLLVTTTSSFSQSTPEYYQYPTERNGRISPLQEEPDWEQPRTTQAQLKRANFKRLLARYGTPYTVDRWYVGLDGFLRTDKGTLNQTFGDLIGTKPVNKFGWSAMVGWIRHEQWAVEVGYARSPIHTLLIINQRSPLQFQSENDKQGLIFRGKRLVTFRPLQNAAPTGRLWLGLGLWLLPNSYKEPTITRLSGYTYRSPRSRPDTIRLNSVTEISPHITGLLEASAEYTVRMGGRSDVSFFVRKNWGLGSSLTTNLTYQVNNSEPQQAWLRGTGTGWSFGVAFRYTYSRRYDLQPMRRVYDLRGNRPQKENK
jgi:hypothetical protein